MPLPLCTDAVYHFSTTLGLYSHLPPQSHALRYLRGDNPRRANWAGLRNDDECVYFALTANRRNSRTATSNPPDEEGTVVTVVCDDAVVTTEATVEAGTVDGGTVTESPGYLFLKKSSQKSSQLTLSSNSNAQLNNFTIATLHISSNQ